MRQSALILASLFLLNAINASGQTASGGTGTAPAKPATSKVDPARAAAHAKEDIKRHRTFAAAHEAAAKCQESGKPEALCMDELTKACKGIAYGKYCGMKHD